MTSDSDESPMTRESVEAVLYSINLRPCQDDFGTAFVVGRLW
jgi:hypothetical protein